MAARMKTRYESEIRPALIERFGYKSPMQAPKILKVTVNMGVGDGKQDSKIFDAAAEQDQVIDRVRHHGRDPVALGDAELPQDVADAVHPRAELAPGDPLVAAA